MMSPAVRPCTTLVVNRLLGLTLVSSAAPVRSFIVEAGCDGVVDLTFHITLPVAASRTSPVYWAIAGLASAGARILATPAGVGGLPERTGSGAMSAGGAVTGGSTAEIVGGATTELIDDCGVGLVVDFGQKRTAAVGAGVARNNQTPTVIALLPPPPLPAPQ